MDKGRPNMFRNFFRLQTPLKINKTTKILRDKSNIVAKNIQNRSEDSFLRHSFQNFSFSTEAARKSVFLKFLKW